MYASRFRALIALIVFCCGLAPSISRAGVLDDLEPGAWYQVPNSHMRQVAFDWGPDGAPGGISGVIKAWGGGAFDAKQERLLVQGGGHGDYGGNEVYALDLNIINSSPGQNPWSRLSDPPAKSALDPQCLNEDNLTDDDQRRSQHTYSRLAYIPALHALCDTGGSIGYVYCPALRQLDCFDLTTNQWKLNLAEGKSSGTGSVGAVHPVTGQWWLQGGSGSGLLGRFDASSMSWAYGKYDNIPGSSPGNMSAAIDPTRELFIAVGRQRLWALPLAMFQEGMTELSDFPQTSQGGDEVINGSAPGFAYDPVADRMVAWIGGAEVYTLDLDSWQWTKHTLGGDAPAAPARNGTYGRFRYSPKYNVFVVVSSVDEDAYIFKLSKTPAQCQQGQTQPCYAGPAQTQDVGACRAGTQPCSEGGMWGQCQEEILPEQERCGDNIDNNCDGQVDEQCAAPDMGALDMEGADMANQPMPDLGAPKTPDMAAQDLGQPGGGDKPAETSGCGCRAVEVNAPARHAGLMVLLLGVFVGLRRVRRR